MKTSKLDKPVQRHCCVEGCAKDPMWVAADGTIYCPYHVGADRITKCEVKLIAASGKVKPALLGIDMAKGLEAGVSAVADSFLDKHLGKFGQKCVWCDCTSYSQGDKVRVQTGWETRIGPVRLVIVKGHIYHPKSWVMHAYGLGIDTQAMDWSLDDVNSAKVKAVEAVFRRAREIALACEATRCAHNQVETVKSVPGGEMFSKCSTCGKYV